MRKKISKLEHQAGGLIKRSRDNIGLILFVLYVLFIFALLLSPVLGRIVELIERNQGLVTVFFSGLLVILYFMQYRTQKTQEDISQKQSEYTEAANRPVVIVENWYSDGNDVFLKLSNVGNGIAQDLSFQVNVGAVEKSPLLKSKVIGGRVKEHPAALVRVEDEEDSRGNYNPNNYLLEGERGVKFKTKAVSPKEWLDEPAHSLTASFTKVMEYYRENGEQHVYMNPVILYKDISDNRNHERLLSEIVNPYVVWDFQDAIESERKIGIGFPSNVPEGHVVYENPEEYVMGMHTTGRSEVKRALTPGEIETIRKMKMYEEESVEDMTELDEFEEL
jgi:hypothetical protein